MKRLLVLALLVALAAPTAALALRRAPGDGSLSIRNGDGQLQLRMLRGAVIGKVESGVLVVTTMDAIECEALDVWGADRRPKQLEWETIGGDPVTRCEFQEFPNRGTPAAIRFRLEGQRGLTLRPATATSPVEFTVAAVGRGAGWIQGSGGPRDGLWSRNGEDYASLPDDRTSFRLATLVP